MKECCKKAIAFTLAEILIALTIIGVVSALTIPNLTKNTQAAHSKTAFKKAIAQLNQAIMEYVNDEGENLAQAKYTSTEADQMPTKLFTRYLGGRETNRPWDVVVHLAMPTYSANTSNAADVDIPTTFSFQSGVLKIGSGNSAMNYGYYILPDNTSVIVPKTIMGCGMPHVWLYDKDEEDTHIDNYKFSTHGNYSCLAYIDINGPKGPNQAIIGVSSNDPTKDACARIIRPEDDYMVTNSDKEFCKLTDDAITDIYPIVLFNDKAYPATVAGYWVLNDLVGQEIPDSDEVITPAAP